MASDDTPRASKASVMSFDVSAFLKVCVGEAPNEKTFLLHEAIICARSELFGRIMMDGKWAEKDERIVQLPNYDVDSFGLYVNLVYTGKIPTHLEGSQPPTVDTLSQEHESLAKLYVLCDKLLDTSAKNSTVRAIVAVSAEVCHNGTWAVPPTSAIRTIYEGTLEGSPARRLMVELWVSATPEMVKSRNWPFDFVMDLAVAWRSKLPGIVKEANRARASKGTPYLEDIDDDSRKS